MPGRVVGAVAMTSVIVGVVVGRVVLSPALMLDFSPAAMPVAVDGVVDAAAPQAREGDPPLQHFELEPAADSFLARLHGRDSLNGLVTGHMEHEGWRRGASDR